MNALVLYVGVQAINQHDNRHTPSQSTIAHSAHMDIFQHLAIDLDNEGKHLAIDLDNEGKHLATLTMKVNTLL